ncbi:hypothetical protein BVY04_03000 [bacterium M21]|nr:hypothetical protein BVY04_03000 [bacterium M21]
MTKKRCGSGLLPYPELIDEFLDTICSTIHLRLSVKVRLGLSSKDEISAVLPILNRYPLEHVTIHPRLASQMYDGTVNLDAFDACQGLCTHKLIYNGDLFTPADFTHVSERFPDVDHWMFGRGLFANPFLLEEICSGQPTAAAEKATRLKAFHDGLMSGYAERLSGEAHLIKRMCSHWDYLQGLLPDGPKAYRRFRKAKSLPAYQQAVADALAHLSVFHG